MSSNTLREVRAHVKETIKPHLPTRWRVFPSLNTPTKLTVPAVYFEFTEVTTEIAGKPIGQGYVAAGFELAVVIPETAGEKAEDNADAAVLNLIQALDNAEGLFWGPTATKLRLDTGQLGWRIPVTVLTSTVPETTTN